jgi:hypothetical protein
VATRVPLLEGSYTARNVIAAAQRCLNLYMEKNPRGEDSPSTAYQTPGLSRLGVPPEVGTVRGLYQSTNGQLFAAVGSGIYFIDGAWEATLLGTIAANTTPVKMRDNGVTLVIVDGSAFGWTVNVVTHVFAVITDPNFFGANFVEIIDTFFLFNKPNSNIFYVSPSNYTAGASGTDLVIHAGNVVSSASHAFGPLDVSQTINITAGTGFLVGFYTIVSTALGEATLNTSPGTVGSTAGVWAEGDMFDPLYFAAKSGYPDQIAGITAQNRNLWIIGGQQTSEIWFDAGAADFPFQIMPGPFIEHGTISIYSIANMGGSTFWLAQDLGGTAFVVEGSNFAALRISTWAIEQAIASYPILTNAIGFCYSQAGHAFYWLKFPSQGVDWVYDLTTKLWHERQWLSPTCDPEGHRAFCAIYAYGVNICGDRLTGQLYQLDLLNPTDAGQPIERRRGFPHLMHDGARQSYPKFTADMQAGTVVTTPSSAGIPAGLAGPAPFPVSVNFIETTFKAPNDTLLSNYYIPFALAAGDQGSQYTLIDATNTAEIESDVLTGVGSGTTSYLASGVPTSADYICQFEAIPVDPTGLPTTGNGVAIRGRCISSRVGYQLSIQANATAYEADLTVMAPQGTDLNIGPANSVFSLGYFFQAADIGRTLTIASGTGFTPGAYVITATSLGSATLASSPGTLGSTKGVWSEPIVSTNTVVLGLLRAGHYTGYLSMQGSAITVAVQRTQDDRWVNSGGIWQTSFAAAISITDGTYPLKGDVLIGGLW